VLHLSDPPELNIEHKFTPYLIERAQGEANLQEFVQALREFARDTQFMDFFNRHHSLYQSIEADIRNKLGDNDYIGLLENYYGIHQHSYTIIPALLFHGGGFGPRMTRPDGSLDIYYIGGLRKIENDQLIFQTEESLRDLAWHEFSHSFVNPLTEKHWKELEMYGSLIDPILTFLNRVGYASWDACVNEHIVRAVTIRFAYREIGKEEGDKALKFEKLAGWFYLDPILTKLVDYELHRQQYATFTDFFPEIVKEFKRLHEAKLGDDFYWMPYDGTINSILFQKKSLVVIVPTNEPDKESEKRLQEIQNAWYGRKGIPVITDVEAMQKDLSKNFILVVGTVEGNLWLKKHAAEFPFKIYSDKVVADKEYPGKEIRLMTTMPNPDNPERGVLIYTAQSTFNVIRCPVGRGTADYAVADGWKVLKSGFYKKDGKNWTY
jgi:hypothetical protein